MQDMTQNITNMLIKKPQKKRTARIVSLENSLPPIAD